jgi:WD40 repeat protein
VVPDGQLLHTLTGAGAAISAIDISPDSVFIAAGAGEPQGYDGSIRVWRVDTGELVHHRAAGQ